MARSRALLAASALILQSAALGCSRQSVPDPKAAVDAYARAAERGDSAALYSMLTEDSQRTYGPKGTTALVRDARAELSRKARAVTEPNRRIDVRGQVRFADGEVAQFELSRGQFGIAAAGVLPAGAKTPAQALDELRQALARRSYPSLLRALSTERQAALESDVRSLVAGLEDPETLDIKISGDTAKVVLPGGHSVKLKREAGVWRIDDFD